MDWTSLANLAKWSAIGLAGPFVARWLYLAGRTVYDDIYERWRDWRHDRLTLQHINTQNRLNDLRAIYPDSAGRLPLLYGENGILRDPNNLRAFTLEAVRETWPALEQLDWTVKTLLAMQHARTSAAHQMPTLAAPIQPAAWPARVTLSDLLARGRVQPGLHRLALGETIDPTTGQANPVVADMTELVHALVSGASGYGKSTLLEAMAKQLALGGDCDICAIDYGVNTFGMLADHLIYPIADDAGSAQALLRELIRIGRERKERFRDYPQVKTLAQYNTILAQTGHIDDTSKTPLRPIVCLIDETPDLLENEGVKGCLQELARMARKFGIGLVCGGTDFKATTLPSSTSGNFGARIGFHLQPGLSRSLLHCTDAFRLNVKGRALALLPGQPMVELQCPQVDTWDDLPPRRPQIALQPCSEPPAPSPLVDQADDPSLPDAERVRRLHRAGLSDTAIARRVFRYGNPFYIDKVRRILAGEVVVAGQAETSHLAVTTVSDDNNTHSH